MKRLLAIGMIIGCLCTSMVWAQFDLNTTQVLASEDDPNDPNEPLVEWSNLIATDSDPNEPNEPLVEMTCLLAPEGDPNEPNEPLVE